MAILPIYLYNQPVLKQKAIPIEEMTDEVVEFVKNMRETMKAAPGVGLAANQVGSRHAAIVVDISGVEDEENTELQELTLINPVIEHFSDELNEYEEGCLSLPYYFETVERPAAVQLKYYDIDMREHTREIDGMLARVVQHEVDHLNGIYFFERLTPMKKALAHNKLKRIQRGLVETEYPVRVYKPGKANAKRRRK